MTEMADVRTRKTGRSLEAPSGLLEKAKELSSLLNSEAEAGEVAGELTPAVVDALHETGLWRMWTPRVLGGLEARPVESLQIIEELCHADGSTGWVLMAAGLATGTGGAYLGEAAVERIFGGERAPIIEGQGTPNGRATVEDGGFVLSGKWSYGSGVKHCDFIHTGAIVCETDGSFRLLPDGSPEVRVFVLPREQVELGANWDVLGLRATGSIDYSIEPTFVPEEYTHLSPTETPLRGGALYTLGIPGFGAIGHSAFAMGVGRRILDELAGLVQAGIARPGQNAENAHFQTEFGAAEAKYRAARAFVYETWNDIEATLERGDALTTRQRTLARLALNHVTWAVAEVCSFAYVAAGGLSLRQSTIQRYFRDMHAGTQHFVVGQPVLRECGRELLGLAPGKVWRFVELIDPV
jgi:alkylation response protein AidB-like acyl-CoA dehydrogenase